MGAFAIKTTTENTIPPPLRHIQIYFDQKGFSEAEAQQFFQYYDKRNWTGKSETPIKNWKSTALEWIWQTLKNSPYQRSKIK